MLLTGLVRNPSPRNKFHLPTSFTSTPRQYIIQGRGTMCRCRFGEPPFIQASSRPLEKKPKQPTNTTKTTIAGSLKLSHNEQRQFCLEIGHFWSRGHLRQKWKVTAVSVPISFPVGTCNDCINRRQCSIFGMWVELEYKER